MRGRESKGSNRGVTLVELLVAIALTGVISSSIILILGSSIESYTSVKEYMELQHTADGITREIIDGSHGLRNARGILKAAKDSLSFFTDQTAIFKDTGDQIYFQLDYNVKDNNINRVAIFSLVNSQRLRKKSLTAEKVSVYRDLSNRMPAGGYKEGEDFIIDRERGIIIRRGNMDEIVFVNYYRDDGEEVKNEMINFLPIFPRESMITHEQVDFTDTDIAFLLHRNIIKRSVYVNKKLSDEKRFNDSLIEGDDYLIDHLQGSITRLGSGVINKGDIVYLSYSYYNYTIDGRTIIFTAPPRAEKLKIVYYPDANTDISDAVITYRFNMDDSRFYKTFRSTTQILSRQRSPSLHIDPDKKGAVFYYYTHGGKEADLLSPSDIYGIKIVFTIEGDGQSVDVENFVGIKNEIIY